MVPEVLLACLALLVTISPLLSRVPPAAVVLPVLISKPLAHHLPTLNVRLVLRVVLLVLVAPLAQLVRLAITSLAPLAKPALLLAL